MLAAALGCGKGVNEKGVYQVPMTPAEKNLSHIAAAYEEAYSKLGRGPKDAAELKPFLKEHGNPDELLVSPNDGEPFVVIWGKKPAGGPTEYKGLFPILAYESKGSGGARAVTDIRGVPKTVPDEDFGKLKFLGGHKPATN